MKICIVLPCNVYIAPFYLRYVKLLKNLNVKFDLVYWNRANIEEETYSENEYSYMNKDQVNSGSFNKYIKYIGFYLYVKKHLKENQYDRVFILSSYAGIMVLLSGFLKREYNQRYWLDVRDYTFENIKIYYLGMKRAIKSSAFSVISSEGYRAFLPEWPYLIVHNIDLDNIEKSFITEKIENNKQIRVSFIGLVRYFDENKKLLTAFKNDERFNLQYYGMNSEEIASYCSKAGIQNTDFYGRFIPSETSNFYKKTDIINNVYGNSGIELTTALSNKLYFAAALKIPILVSKNTLMEKISTEYGFGYAIDFDDPNLIENVYSWYNSIDWIKFNENCEKFIKKVENDEEKFKNALKNFLTKDSKN